MTLTVRDIQKIQAGASRLGYFSLPNTGGVGLLDRSAGYFATQQESLDDYIAHMNLSVPGGYLMKPFATDDMWPDFNREYVNSVQTQDSNLYDWNKNKRVMGSFFKPGRAARMIPLDLVTPESLAELFAA